LMVAVLVKVEDDRRAAQTGRLVHLAVQCSHSRRRSPVYSAERITGLVGTHSRDARRILEQTMRQPHVADRPARRQVVAGQRNDLWIDKQETQPMIHAEAPMQTEEVAVLHDEWTNLIIAALQALDLIAHARVHATAQHADLQTLPLDHLETRETRIEGVARQ